MTEIAEACAIPLGKVGFRDAVIPFFHERGFRTLGDFVGYTSDQLVEKGIVGRRLGFVREKLAENGLTLKTDGVFRTLAGTKGQTVPLRPVVTDSGVGAEVGLSDETPEGEDDDLVPLKGLTVMPDGTTDLNAYTRNNQGLVYWMTNRTPYKRVVQYEDFDRALELVDLYQEAFIGFLVAIKKFDSSMGKFSTYAWHWINQRLSRLFKNSGLIRIPVHLWEVIWVYLKTEKTLRNAYGQKPSPEDIQRAMGLSDVRFETVQATIALHLKRVLSISQIVGNPAARNKKGSRKLEDRLSSSNHEVASDSSSILESIADEREDAVIDRLTLQRVLQNASLLEAEQLVLVRLYGLDGEARKTLQEVGDELGVTRERIRQREAAALKKLRNPRLWEVLPEEVELLGDESSAIEVAPKSVPPAPTRDKDGVLRFVADFYRCSTDDLLGRSRVRPLAQNRQILMYLLRECVKLTLVEIGKFLERDHSTVVHGCVAVEEVLATDPVKAAEINQLVERLRPVFQDSEPQNSGKPIQSGEFTSPDIVFESVCEYYGTSAGDLLGGSRDPLAELPRKVVLYLLTEYTPQVFWNVGRNFIRRDQTVARTAHQWVSATIQREEELREDVNEIRWIIGNKSAQKLDE